MNPENDNLTAGEESNEDLQFDRSTVSTTDTQAIQDNEMDAETEPVDQSKQEELASNEVPPLSEVEKQPKLQDP